MTIKLTLIDWTIIVLYFAFILGIGVYLRRYTETGKDFFLAGRKSSSWVAGLAFLSANLGALEILGWTGATCKYGMYVAHFYWVGAIPAMLFLGIFMMPFYYSSKIYSVPGYLKERFDERTRLLNAISFAIMTILMSGINMYLMALVFRLFLGWNWHVSIWISALTVAGYVALGGLLSAIFTEIVQFFLIWFGLFLVAILGFVEVKGDVLAGLPEAMTSLWATSGDPSMNAMGVTWAGIILGLGFVLSFGYWTTDFLVVQRAFSSKDLRAAQMCPVVASYFKMALPLIVVGGGLIALKLSKSGLLSFMVMEDGKVNYDSALPLLLQRYYPPGLLGLGVTALLAGFMAGQAGNISAFNTVWTYDIYRAMIRRKASEKELVWMGRFITVVGIFLSVASAYWAMKFPTIMDYIQAIFSWVNAPLFATILLGMFWRKTTSAGAFYGLLVGMLSSFSMFVGLKLGWIPSKYLTFSEYASEMSNNLWRAWWAWLICFIITIVVSLLTKPKPYEELKGLVKGFITLPGYESYSFLRRPSFWALISFAVLIFLNIYFW